MTLDEETRRALGYGDHWEQLALRFPLFVVARKSQHVPRAQRRTYDARYEAKRKAAKLAWQRAARAKRKAAA